MKNFIFSALFSFVLPTVFAQTGQLVPAFGSGGTQSVLFNTLDKAHSVAQQADGKILVVGYSNTSPGRLAIARFLANGTLDASFDGDGKLSLPFTVGGSSVSTAEHKLLIQPDGKFLVSGDAIGATTIDFTVFRFNADGSLDNSFDGDGKVQINFGASSPSSANDLILDPNGRIVLAGFATIASKNQFAIARLNANGSLDNSFDSDGKMAFPVGSYADRSYGLALQADGKLVLAGSSSTGNIDHFALARVNANGGLDASFDTDGVLSTGLDTHGNILRDVAVQPDGKIVAAGSCYGTGNGGFAYNFSAIRVNANGSLDPGFGNAGKLIANLASNNNNDQCQAMLLQSDGKMLLVGHSFIAPSFYPKITVLRLTSSGTYDATFGTGGYAEVAVETGGNYGTALCLLQNGTVLVAGNGQSNTTNNTGFVLANFTTGLPVGLAPEVQELEIELSPNPAAEQVRLKLPFAVSTEMEVEWIHSNGQMWTQALHPADRTDAGIQLVLPHDLPPGLYQVRVRTDRQIWRVKNRLIRR